MRVGSDAELGARAGLYSQRGSSLFFDRLMFPLRNQTGDVVGFAGRALPLPEGREGSGGPKYLNGKESHWFKKDELLDLDIRDVSTSEQFPPGGIKLTVGRDM